MRIGGTNERCEGAKEKGIRDWEKGNKAIGHKGKMEKGIRDWALGARRQGTIKHRGNKAQGHKGTRKKKGFGIWD